MAPHPRSSSWLRIVAGDTQIDKLLKLAIVKRDIAETIESFEGNPSIKEGQAKQMHGVLDRLERAIPYSTEDVDNLRQEQQRNPRVTLADIVKRRKAAPAASTNPFSTPLPAALPSAQSGSHPTDIQSLIDAARGQR